MKNQIRLRIFLSCTMFLSALNAASPSMSYAQMPAEIFPQTVLSNIESMNFSPDGRYLLTASVQGVTLWDFASRREIRKFTKPLENSREAIFSPDGKYAAAGVIDHEPLSKRMLNPVIKI